MAPSREIEYSRGKLALSAYMPIGPGGSRLSRGSREAPEMLADCLSKAGATGRWKMNHSGQTKWRAEAKMLLVRPVDRLGIHKAARVRIKPGDNSTCWEWVVTPPKMLDPDEADRLLNRAVRIANDEPTDDLLSRVNAALGPKDHWEEVQDVVLGNGQHEAAPKAGTVTTHRVTVASENTTNRLTAKIAEMESRSDAYAAREKKIAELRDRADRLMLEATEAEAEQKRLQAEHEADAQGKEAAGFIEQFHKMLLGA